MPRACTDRASGAHDRPHTVVAVPAPETAPADPSGGPQAPSLLRRFGAWLVDWVVCTLFVFVALPYDLSLDPAHPPPTFLGAPQSSWVVLGVFAVYTTVLVGFAGGRTLGHRLFGLQVWQVRPGSFLLQAAWRTVLVCLLLPAVIPAGRDRCLHDAWAGTRIVRL